MIGTLDVGEVAVEHAICALRRLHFSNIRHRTGAGGSTILEAWTGSQHILVRVNPAVAPAEPAELSPDEKQELRQRAADAGGEAWEARVVVGPDSEPLGLEWWPLERGSVGR